MAIFTADLEKELEQIKASCDDLLNKSVLPTAQTLVHEDLKPATKELLMETRFHGVYLLEHARKECEQLISEAGRTATGAISLIDERLQAQQHQFHQQLRKTIVLATICIAGLIFCSALAYRLAV